MLPAFDRYDKSICSPITACGTFNAHVTTVKSSYGCSLPPIKAYETPTCQVSIRNRLVYNDWGLYGFVQTLAYKCLHYGKELSIIDERDTTRMCHKCKRKQDMPVWQRTYRCANCGLVMDRDENSAVNIYQRFFAGLPPHR